MARMAMVTKAMTTEAMKEDEDDGSLEREKVPF